MGGGGGGSEGSETTVQQTGDPRDSGRTNPLQDVGSPAPSGNSGHTDTPSFAPPRPNPSTPRMEESGGTSVPG